jgi:hypothetical protein
VPRGTELDSWQGCTLASVVGFLFADTRLLGVPVPAHRTFEEVNLRFYVRRPMDGKAPRRGVVFIRELVPREAIAALARYGLAPDELAIHLGPAICGRCYEVSADVREQLTGQPVTRPGHVDLRSLIAEHATETGVQKITVSPLCTKCDNDRFFSHRAGDPGRQIAVIAAQA